MDTHNALYVCRAYTRLRRIERAIPLKGSSSSVVHPSFSFALFCHSVHFSLRLGRPSLCIHHQVLEQKENCLVPFDFCVGMISHLAGQIQLGYPPPPAKDEEEEEGGGGQLPSSVKLVRNVSVRVSTRPGFLISSAKG